jgi:hypothetical protein
MLTFCSVLPLINAFTFGDEEKNLDDTLSVLCSMAKGDIPMNIWWTITNDDTGISTNLSSFNDLTISKNGQKMSLLNIEALKHHHRGTVTCWAQNRAGLSSHSVKLSINGHYKFLLSSQKFRILQFPSFFI